MSSFQKDIDDLKAQIKMYNQLIVKELWSDEEVEKFENKFWVREQLIPLNNQLTELYKLQQGMQQQRPQGIN